MTTYRLARTLRDEGYLVADRASGLYSLGPAMLAGSYLRESYEQIGAAARPYLEALADETGETVTLAVEVRGEAVCVDVVRSRRPGRLDVAAGRLVSDPASAHGKVFAAFQSPARRRRIAHAPHEPRTSRHHHRAGSSSSPSSGACAAPSWPTTSRSATSARARSQPQCATSWTA